MKKIFVTVSIFLICYPIYAQSFHLLERQKKFSAQTDKSTSYNKNKDYFKTILPEANQTPGRRAEVVFFTSLPFVVLSHFLVVGVVSVAQNPSISRLTISPEMGVFIGVSSLAFSGAITVFDHYQHFKNKKEPQVNFSFHKKFH